MNFRNFVLLAYFLFGARCAQAKILFIDLNFGWNERAAAAEAAKLNHEEIVFIPDLSKFSAARIAEMKRCKTEYAAERLRREKTMLTTKRFEELSEYFLHFGVTPAMLTDSIQKTGTDTTRIIISAHSDGNTFEGLFLTLERREMAEILEKGGVAKTALSIYGWGCYSATQGAVIGWQADFPSADVVLGYDTRSDLDVGSAGPSKLKKMLMKEAAMRKEQSAKKILDMMKVVDGNDRRHALAGRVGECYVSTADNRIAIPYDAPPASCIDKIKILNDQTTTVYRPMTLGKRNVPEDINATAIRKYYQLLQQSSTCLAQCSPTPVKNKEAFLAEIKVTKQFAEDMGYNDIPCPAEVLLLVKYPHIVHNYKQMYADEFAYFKNLLKDKKVFPTACFDLLTGKIADNTTPVDLTVLYSCSSDPHEPVLERETYRIAKRIELMLNDRQVPFAWIEELSHPTTSADKVIKPDDGYDDAIRAITKD